MAISQTRSVLVEKRIAKSPAETCTRRIANSVRYSRTHDQKPPARGSSGTIVMLAATKRVGLEHKRKCTTGSDTGNLHAYTRAMTCAAR